MFDIYSMLLSYNSEIYSNYFEVNSKNELIDKFICVFNDYYSFNEELCDNIYDSVDISSCEDCSHLSCGKKINSFIEWTGPGEYCMCDNSSIAKVKSFLDFELQNLATPLPINSDALEDITPFSQQWKLEIGYPYVYFITHINHTIFPAEHILEYILYSNIKIDNVFEYLNDEKSIFIGEFNILGANYSAIEIEDIYMDFYKFDYCPTWDDIFLN